MHCGINHTTGRARKALRRAEGNHRGVSGPITYHKLGGRGWHWRHRCGTVRHAIVRGGREGLNGRWKSREVGVGPQLLLGGPVLNFQAAKVEDWERTIHIFLLISDPVMYYLVVRGWGGFTKGCISGDHMYWVDMSELVGRPNLKYGRGMDRIFT